MSLSSRRAARRGASALEFALTLPVFVVLVVGVADLAWLAFQRSALSSSVALGCRAGALVDPGLGDVDWADLETAAEAGVLDALAATGAGCEPDDCVVTITSFGSDPGRSLGCTVSRDFAPLTALVMEPIRIESTIVVRMEWQR
ncbi:MAG: TadE/TadG family type IV pilus assembly protein [Pseudomonadota bacterium]|nr:TadE/TadG family type IV pilus assembly protein [Pseudomonadota bacterium]